MLHASHRPPPPRINSLFTDKVEPRSTTSTEDTELLSAIQDEIGLTRLLQESIDTGAESKGAHGHAEDLKPTEETIK